MIETKLNTLIDLSSFDTSNGDPESIYEDFFQIGRGNFGCVYSANSKVTGEIVAIKKIEIETKKTNEKYIEIERELNVMRMLNHPNCIVLKDIFIEPSIVWIVMEYCVGSALDLIKMSDGLTEPQISYIVFYTLNALKYIHSCDLIHRDIKAGNILITTDAVIKIADFGCTSLKSPANTFIGSPFWMAPEVILAMDDGQYDAKADIWSMGITSYELGEKNPPHFHMNTMSAIYHIAQSDPPQLLNEKWSEDYKSFTNSMLKKEAADRPTIDELLKFNFVNKQHCSSDLINLLVECSKSARKCEFSAYKKFINMLDEFPSASPMDSTDSKNIQSKSQSLNIISEDTSSENVCIPHVNINRGRVLDPKLGSIKTVMSINDEGDRYDDDSYLHLKDYQALRKSNKKQLKALEQKHNNDFNDKKKLNQKFLETTKASFEKAMKSLLDKRDAELDKLAKQHKSQIKIYEKNRFSDSLESKNIFHSIISIPNRKKSHSKNYSLSLQNTGGGSATALDFKSPIVNVSSCAKIDSINDTYNVKVKEVNLKYIEDHYNLLISHKESLLTIESLHTSSLARNELNKLEHVYRMKKNHLDRLHAAENDSQRDYIKKKLRELEKKHLRDKKNAPHQYKQLEINITKSHKEEIKVLRQSYKTLIKETLEKTPKQNHQIVREKLRAEKMKKIFDKKKQFDQYFSSIINNDMDKLSDTQLKEKNELEEQLNQELNSLVNYQNSQNVQITKSKSRELENISVKYDKILQDLQTKIKNDIEFFKQALNDDIERYNQTNEGTVDFNFGLNLMNIRSSSQKSLTTSLTPTGSLKKGFPQK